MWIDAHHHFWRYGPVEYGWIVDAMRTIRRDLLLGDLRELSSTEQERVLGGTAIEAYKL